MKFIIVQDHRITGGAAKAAWRLGWALREIDHHVIHVCGDEALPEPRETIRLSGKPQKGPARWWDALWPREELRRARVAAAWRQLLEREKPDRVWFHNLAGARKWGWSEEMVTIALEKYDCLWTLHDMWALGSGRDYFPEEELEQEAVRSPLRRIFHAAPRGRLTVTAPSQWLAGLASRVTGERAEFVPNPLDVRIFHPYPRETARALWGFSPTQRVSLAVAENLTDERKGMSFLLQAWRDVRQKEDDLLCLVGRLPKNMPTLSGIRFLGTIDSPSRLAMLYSAADLFVHPAEMENAPCVIQESLACGCPVLARPVGGIPEMIRDGKDGRLADVGKFSQVWRRWMFESRADARPHSTTLGVQAWEMKIGVSLGFVRQATPASFHVEAPEPPVSIPDLNLRVGGEDNLFHWLVYHLGQILFLEKEGRAFGKVYLPEKETDLQKTTLEALGIPSSRLRRSPCEKPGAGIWKVAMRLSPSAVPDWFYRSLSEKLGISKSGLGLGPKLYLSRRYFSKRKVMNENQLCQALEAAGFLVFFPEKIPWAEQIAAFASADWIVGPHGGAFGNAFFVKPGAHLVELFPAEDDQWFFRQMTESVGGRHSVFQGGPNRKMSGSGSGFEVDPQSLILHLRSLGMS